MPEPKVDISTPQERAAFRIFADLHPVEAADCNWPEFFAMVREMNPRITEDALKEMLKKLESEEKEEP